MERHPEVLCLLTCSLGLIMCCSEMLSDALLAVLSTPPSVGSLTPFVSDSQHSSNSICYFHALSANGGRCEQSISRRISCTDLQEPFADLRPEV